MLYIIVLIIIQRLSNSTETLLAWLIKITERTFRGDGGTLQGFSNSVEVLCTHTESVLFFLVQVLYCILEQCHTCRYLHPPGTVRLLFLNYISYNRKQRVPLILTAKRELNHFNIMLSFTLYICSLPNLHHLHRVEQHRKTLCGTSIITITLNFNKYNIVSG